MNGKSKQYSSQSPLIHDNDDTNYKRPPLVPKQELNTSSPKTLNGIMWWLFLIFALFMCFLFFTKILIKYYFISLLLYNRTYCFNYVTEIIITEPKCRTQLCTLVHLYYFIVKINFLSNLHQVKHFELSYQNALYITFTCNNLFLPLIS